ncbi:hypothetical protein Cassandra_0198 [Pseudomonas phage Cassandra]|nr:hypothetical protein Cassandra_0198 [Pseudomonas phage Cassandra]WPK39394.1 hypothetical protein Deiofobo_0197 [Pseudomonas phage Deifobo]WPK39907.1 hypothetical protein ETTORE_0198 [Pseudomonas phage Ettore]WPK40427.1 hypothetical protein Paride_0197 [Pseudomonas phage Paride]
MNTYDYIRQNNDKIVTFETILHISSRSRVIRLHYNFSYILQRMSLILPDKRGNLVIKYFYYRSV